MSKANPGTPGRAARAPGDIAMAALLAAGACAERARGRGHRAWRTAVPVIFVNFVAFYGQLTYFQAHRHVQPGILVPAAVAVVMALALESIAVFLSWQAHVARLADDSAFRLRLGAYSVALVIGALNYSHFCAPHWRPTAYAVAFALASAISPALWGVHSNRESRPLLKDQELIEKHAVRLGPTRWFWHPVLSAKVQRLAAWAGVNRPAAAIALYEDRQDAKRARAGKRDKPPGGAARGLDVSREQHSGPAHASVTPLTECSPAGEAPPPVLLRREPRRAANELREARSGQGLAAASRELEDKVLAELLARPEQELPAWRALSRERFGTERSHAARRVLEKARAARNGGSHGEGS